MPSHLYLPSSSSSSSDASPSSSCSVASTMACISAPVPPQPPVDHRTTTNITSRPKLKLQTSSLPRTSGSSTTGLSFSFSTGPGASPTVRNTFKNAYDVTSPSSATSSPCKAPSANNRWNSSKPSSPYAHLNQNPNPFTQRSPYHLPLGVRSILRNSPLEPSSRHRSGSISATSITAPGGGSGPRRVFFPAKKQVAFRYPLVEEVRTELYTAQHVELFMDEKEENEKEKVEKTILNNPKENPSNTICNDEPETDSDHSSLSQLSETSTSSGETSADDEDRTTLLSLSKAERKKRRSLGVERQVRAVALLDGFEADPYASSMPQSPRQGRVKRRRDWKWTLGPIAAGSESSCCEGDGDGQPPGRGCWSHI